MPDLSNLSITRNELQQKKQQLELTHAGYDLLDRKRLALMQEILKLQDEVVKLATELEKDTTEARKALAKAESMIGESGVSSASMGNKREMNIDVSVEVIMGVHVSRLQSSQAVRKFSERGISPVGTSLVIDEAASVFEYNVDTMIRLADCEGRLAQLSKEIFKTTRRLKALEHIIMPQLQYEFTYIMHALEERERAGHYALKIAKDLLQKKYAAAQTKLFEG